jgi:CRISPR-associated protein Csx17
VTEHVLPGLRPDPLASYLAGLGLIRVLAAQADPALTAAWTPGGLRLRTSIAGPAAWLAAEYMPTPVLSPWNNGSGFGAKDKEPKRVLEQVNAHPSARLGRLREAVAAAHQALATAADSQDFSKRRVIQEYRNRCPEDALPWVDAAVVLGTDDTFFPPLLGTGGNDGRLDFSTNFHQRLLEILDPSDKAQQRSRALAADLLSGTQTAAMTAAAVGQFDPNAAGGPGSSRFGAADSLVNPWGYVLMVEGALMFAAGAVRRYQHDVRRAAIPFTVRESPDGSASGAAGEVSRGEVWVPVWTSAFSMPEIRQLFGEARAAWRGRPARQAVEFYAATRTHGVARGVTEFVRYGLHQRNGLAFAAVPVDRVRVKDSPPVSLVGPLDDWVAQVRRAAPSASVAVAVRQFDHAFLEFVRDAAPLLLAHLLAALTAVEMAVSRSGVLRAKVAPRRRLPAAGPFLGEFSGMECAELRVAAGLASCATFPGGDAERNPARTLRDILLPLTPSPHGPAWADAPLVAGFGVQPLPYVLAKVAAWRARTAADEREGTGPVFRGVPAFRRGIGVPAADLHSFAAGQLDEKRLEEWLRACLALDWSNSGRRRTGGVRWHQVPAVVPVPVLGLLHPLAAGLEQTTGAVPAGAEERGGDALVAMRPDWATRLAAGQVTEVHEEAVMRLRETGWIAAEPLRDVLRPDGTWWIPGDHGPDGVHLAAALAPRAQGCFGVLKMLAVRSAPQADTASNNGPHIAPDPDLRADQSEPA